MYVYNVDMIYYYVGNIRLPAQITNSCYNKKSEICKNDIQ